MRFFVGDARRVRFRGLAAAVMVMRVLQDGQFICRPSQSLLARMGWRQVGQLKVNSFMGTLRLFLEVQDAQDDSVWEETIGWIRPRQALTFGADGRVDGGSQRNPQRGAQHVGVPPRIGTAHRAQQIEDAQDRLFMQGKP